MYGIESVELASLAAWDGPCRSTSGVGLDLPSRVDPVARAATTRERLAEMMNDFISWFMSPPEDGDSG